MTPADRLETVAAIASPAAVPWRARWRRVERDVTLATLLLAVSALAWGALWWWSASPYGRYAGHGGWLELAALADLCRAVPAGTTVVPALLHALAWVLMIAAMMLPTTFPVVTLFRRIVAGRADAGRLVALLILGFFAAWFAFGLVAHAADALVQWGAGRLPALATHGWALSALVLAGAGWFQFSALKYRCLDACHTPFAFVASRWHGRVAAPGSVAARARPRRVLHRLLRAADARHVRRRHRQPGLDAGARGRHGRREEPARRPPAARAPGRRARRVGGGDRRHARLGHRSTGSASCCVDAIVGVVPLAFGAAHPHIHPHRGHNPARGALPDTGAPPFPFSPSL